MTTHPPSIINLNCACLLEISQLIQESTHYTGTTETCIDHVLVSPGLANANAWVIDAEIADHLPIAICHKLKKGKNPGNNQTSKNTMINYKKLDHLMSNINLEDIEKYSANVAFNKLQQVVTSNVKQSQYIASRKQTPRNPWIKQSTIQLVLTVDRLRRKYIRSPTIENETAYKTNKKLHQKKNSSK